MLTKFNGLMPEKRPSIPKQLMSSKLRDLMNIMNNSVLPSKIDNVITYSDLNLYLYSSAATIVKLNGGKLKETFAKQPKLKRKKPPWERRLEQKINELRADAGIITAYINNRNKKLEKKMHAIRKKYSKHAQFDKPNSIPSEYLDTVKQKLSAYAKRLRRYKKKSEEKGA